MKKILIIMLTSIFAISAKAQLSAPNELHCTEQAITFKADISSGWHLNMFRVGVPEDLAPVAGNAILGPEMVNMEVPKPRGLSNNASPFKAIDLTNAVQSPLTHNNLLASPVLFWFSYIPVYSFPNRLTTLQSASFYIKNNLSSVK